MVVSDLELLLLIAFYLILLSIIHIVFLAMINHYNVNLMFRIHRFLGAVQSIINFFDLVVLQLDFIESFQAQHRLQIQLFLITIRTISVLCKLFQFYDEALILQVSFLHHQWVTFLILILFLNILFHRPHCLRTYRLRTVRCEGPREQLQ